MWSTWSESAKSSITAALEKTGDVISKAATNARHHGNEPTQQQPSAASTSTTNPTDEILSGEDTTLASSTAEGVDQSSNKQADVLLKNLQVGWTSMLESTKAGIKVAQEKLEEEQHKLTERIHKARSAYYKRDLDLPLDVIALKDAEVVYLTDRLITLSHPATASTSHPEVITAERKLAAVGHLLQKRHGGRFMVWNLSEVEYDIGVLDDQVLTFSFPGSPSPPLGLLLKLLISMESWLKADERNVAVVHCLTGKGRTSTVMAAFLCWMGEAGFCDIYDALAYIASCKHLTPEDLTIPSQRRYASYFKNMLDSVRPSQPPLLLQRVIMSEAPRFAKGPPVDQKDGDGSLPGSGKSTPTKSVAALDDDLRRMGCAPYLQVFKGGKLLHTAPASLTSSQQQANSGELTFCQVADGSVSFHINQVVQGDILIRCRHMTTQRQRVSMYRAAFHTGYVPPKVMRLTKSQLDGACNDARFPDDFFLDLIFEAVDAETASKLLRDGASEEIEVSAPSSNATSLPPAVKSGGSEQAKLLAGGSTTVQASAYDTMLHRDSRFWEVIAARREKHSLEQGKELDDPNWGPTVGRRREFGVNKSDGKGTKADRGKASGQTKEQVAALETFSIGGEFDFLPETVEPEQDTPTAASVPKPPKKDSLMEALMGALIDDEHREFEDSEEIVFAEDTVEESSRPPTSSNPVSNPVAIATPTIVQLPPLPLTMPSHPQAPPSEPSSTAPVSESTPDATSESRTTSAASASSSQVDMLDAKSEALDSDIDALLSAGVDDLDLEIGDEDLLAVDDADIEDMESFLASGTTARK